MSAALKLVRSPNDINQLLAKKVMHFTGAKYFKNGGGCYPEDAKPINDEPGMEWGATSKGGSYPFLAGDTLFYGKDRPGVTWRPTADLSQAMMVVEEIRSNGHPFSLESLTPNVCLWKATFSRRSAEAETPELAICMAAMELLDRKEI